MEPAGAADYGSLIFYLRHKDGATVPDLSGEITTRLARAGWSDWGCSIERYPAALARYRHLCRTYGIVPEGERIIVATLGRWAQGEVPDLDTLCVDQLRLFRAFACGAVAQFKRRESFNLGSVSARNARLLFPGRKKGHVKALRLLKNYASNREALTYCPSAEATGVYNIILQLIRDELPNWARWY